MATWKKILREEYAVGATDGLLTLTTQEGTAGDGGDFIIRLSDDRTGATEGAGNENITISLGAGLTAGTGSISLTNTHVGFIGDTGNVDIDLGSDLSIVGSGGISTDITGSTLTISLDDVVAITVAGDSGTDQSIDFNDTLSILGSNGISTTTSATDTVTITAADLTFTAGTGTQAVSLGDSFNIAGAGGISTAVSGDEVTITFDDTVGITLTADSGDDQTIAHDSTVDIAGGTGISTVVEATGTVTVNMDNTTFTAAGDTGSDAVALGETLTFLGGTGISTAVTENTVTITSDAEAPQVTTDLAGTTTYYMLLQNGGSITDGQSVDLSAFIDTGAAGSVGPQYTPSTGTLRVSNLVVDGTSTSLNVETVTTDDPVIVLNNDGGALASNQGGIELNTGTNNAAHMVYNSANSNLTGWQVSTSGASQDLHTVAVMDHAAGTPSGNGAGSGTFYFDTTNGILYVDVA